jgi:large subunit ribosomal protein L6
VLIKNFLGERSPRVTWSLPGVKVTPTKEEVTVSGADKDAVGETTALIQKKCRIRNKDDRTFQDGVYVYKKALGTKVFWEIK